VLYLALLSLISVSK